MKFYIIGTLVCSVFYAIGAILCKLGLQSFQQGSQYSLISRIFFLVKNKIWLLGIAITLSSNLAILQIQSVLDLSVVHAILNSSYIFALFLSYFVFNETLTKSQWIGICFVMIGAALIFFMERPITGGLTNIRNLIGLTITSISIITIFMTVAIYNKRINYDVMYALCAGIAFGVSQVYVKATTNQISMEIGYFSVLSLDSLSEFLKAWPSIAVVGFGIFGFICMQISLSKGKVSICIALLAVISRAISTSSGYYIFGEKFPLLKIMAIGVILLGVFIIAFSSVKNDKMKESYSI